jgi:hypothetical protein
MSSFSRNSRRAHSYLRPRAIGAGLALALASAGALADEAHRFVFTAYTDAAGGAEVLAGRYRAALEELNTDPDEMDFDASETNTNRCVAYSMTLQWQEARATCDAAVREAAGHRVGAPGWFGWTRESQDEDLALAYANRAVMHWLSGDQAAADEDLGKARGLTPHAYFVTRNVAALQMHLTVARAATTAPKS